jgi:uncharacterized protein involved in tolerance to divalent cations
MQVQRFNYVKTYTMHEGKVRQEEEKVLLIKTTEDKLEKCKEMITKNHPYKELSQEEYMTMLSLGN